MEHPVSGCWLSVGYENERTEIGEKWSKKWLGECVLFDFSETI